MSIVALKRKTGAQYKSKISGKPPGGYWVSQGPFGHSTNGLQLSVPNYGPEGFSINGGRRNVGYVGKDSKFSRNGTPFRGTEPTGYGGSQGNYYQAQPVYNANRAITQGDQYSYIKPSVLSTYGMLAKKYRWARNGKYPNYWVQPVNTGNQVESSSQGMYIHEKTIANLCVQDVNNPSKYDTNIVNTGPTLCHTSAAKFTFNDMVRNAPYTKTLQQPMSSSQHTMFIQRKCSNPKGAQKPFPFAVQTGTGIMPSGTSVRNIGNACNTSNTYLTPPEWYLK